MSDQPQRNTLDVGDWIRFQRGGGLVVGVVAYLAPRASWDSTLIPVTAEYGPVQADILEVRKPTHD